jgi:hypothetical protein
VQLAERQLAIQVKRELELFPSPAIVSHRVLLIAVFEFESVISSLAGSGVSGKVEFRDETSIDGQWLTRRAYC